MFLAVRKDCYLTLSTLLSYNKWMTYKIADLLFKNGYILLFEQQKIKGEKMQFPQIEIKNYIDNYK